MVRPRIIRPATRLLSSILPSPAPRALPAPLACCRPAFTPRTLVPSISSRRNYATPSGVKEVAVRDALNEALAEELELDDKVFILGEEVAQYNGAYVHQLQASSSKLVFSRLLKLQGEENRLFANGKLIRSD